ncbi:MAG TPA: TetR/AcrR family transcriptional regulator [Iamia sp.]|nr:TetR/AcrR family transcriptional regulator [Iamia sp.]
MTDTPDVRTRLVAAAARLLAEGGPDKVSVRRVATEIGTSTMAVYTHFGGKPELLRAVSVEGFRHLAARLAEVEPTDDPVADIAALGRAYRRAALDDPHLFTAMFGRNVGELLDRDDERGEALATFITLVDAVQRAIDAGRFAPTAADLLALELWCGIHGLCCIELGAGLHPPDQAPAALASMTRRMAVGAGDDPARAAASIPDPALAQP